MPARSGDHLPRSGEGRTDRGAETLAETDAYGVEMPGPLGGRRARGHDGVEQPSAVQVGRQPMSVGPSAHFGDAGQRLDSPGAAIVRDLEGQHAGVGLMFAIGANQAGQLIEPQQAKVAFDRLDRDSAQLGISGLLVVENVAARLAQKFIARPAMQPDANLIRHRARRDQQRSLLAEELGQAGLEPQDGGVFVENVVADFRGGHCGPHAGGRLGERVAAKIQGAMCGRHGLAGRLSWGFS